MKHSEFVHLHNHTQYSLLDGASLLKPMMEAVQKLKMPSLAITDHGNMFGVIEFYNLSLKYGIKPIIGCEVYVAPNSRFEKTTTHGISEASYHLILLCKDEEGYKNLIKLVSLGYLEGFYYKPRIDKELLFEYSKGLICLTACLKGEIPHLILKGKNNEVKETISHFKDVFGEENFYLELHNHNIEDQYKVNEELLKYSKEINVPVVATNDCHYIQKHHSKIHDVLLCIQTKKTINEENRMKFQTDEFYIKSEEEMHKAFEFLPEAIQNTLVISEKCNLKLSFDRYVLPNYTIPEDFKDLNEYLEEITYSGMKKRFGENPAEEIKSRIKHELDIIKKMNFPGYFLIVWDFIKYAKENNILVGSGRGSVAGSLVAYCLEITEIDPLKYDLFFERFLNPDRISPPDIDVDFEDGRRDEIINYVYSKYGKDNVSQIITFGTLKRKAAVKAVGRVLGLSFQEVNRISKMIPDKFQNEDENEEKPSLKDVIKKVKELSDLIKSNNDIKMLIDIATELEGMTSNVSTHAAGIVIANDALINYIPLYKESGEDGVVTTQYGKNSIEKIGLLKMDFLSLKTLTVIKETVVNVHKNYNIKINIDTLPLDDGKTFNSLCEAKTAGIFQLESAGMRDLLKKLKPRDIKEIIALIALHRPGPIDWIDEFVKRKHGLIPIKYEHPDLEDILRETYGIMLYQEQVMQIAVKLAGFSMSEADTLRKAMSEKAPEIMEKQRLIFLKGTKEKGLSQDKAEKIFNEVVKFAGYGFNKSHSASYALVAYQTAYLKAHFPLEYYAALLTSEIGNADKMPFYIEECKKTGIEIIPPDINRCYTNFTVVGESICFGLSAIKNVGKAASESIINGRKKGEFVSLQDFCNKVDLRLVNKRVIESLIKCGACDSLKNTRLYLMNILEDTLNNSQRIQQEKETGQDFLFENIIEEKKQQIISDEYPEERLLSFEKELLGVYLSGHPLVKYEEKIKKFTNVNSLTLSEFEDASVVSIGGIIHKIDPKTTKRNESMAIISLEDLSGIMEVVVFPKLYQKVSGKIFQEAIVIIKGKLDFEDTTDDYEKEIPKIIAEDIMLLEEAEERLSKKMHIKLFTAGLEESQLENLKTTLTKFNGKGSCQVFLHFINTHSEENFILETSVKVFPTKKLVKTVEEQVGEDNVWLSA